MAITNGYATLDEVRRRIPHIEDDDDTDLESVIEGVSRFIDSDRGRRFYAASETRYYVPISNDLVVVDDLLSITTLKTDEDGDGTFERTWSSSDYLLVPYNATVDGSPCTSVERAFQGSLFFPVRRRRSGVGVRRSSAGFRSVEIVGSFGYTATTPKEIHEACVLLSMRLWERRESLFGQVVVVGEVVKVVPLAMDSELQAMLNTIKKRWSK